MSGAHLLAAGLWAIEQLDAAGVRASLDPGKVNPPGVWVQLGNARPLTLADAWEVELNLYAVSANTVATTAFRELDKLTEKFLATFELRGDLEVVTLDLPAAGGLPAIRYPITAHTP